MTLMDKDRREMIRHYITKAENALKISLMSFDVDCDAAANRAYYSVFNAEKALLLTKGIFGDSHRHVHNSVAKEFVKSGLLSPDTSKKIELVQNIRNTADYSEKRSVTKSEAEEAVLYAKEFLGIVKKSIGENCSNE